MKYGQPSFAFVARDGSYAVWLCTCPGWRRAVYQVWAHPPTGKTWQVGENFYDPTEAAAAMYTYSRPPARHGRKAVA